MVRQVYDSEDRDKDIASLSPGERHDLEQKDSTSPVPAQDKKIEKSTNPDGSPSGMGHKLRKAGEADEAKADQAADDLGQDLSDFWKSGDDDGESPRSNFFRRNKGNAVGIRALFTRRRALGLTIGAALFASLFGLSGLMGVFKMDHLMSNIDAKSFARLNGSLDARSTSYIRTYMALRLSDICPSASPTSCDGVSDTDNLLFKSDKVQRGNPLFNWYRTLRSSSFENDVFNKNGVTFVSYTYKDGDQIKFRAAKIKFDGKDFFNKTLSPQEIKDVETALKSGDWKTVNKGDFIGKNLKIQEFDTNSQARRAIKKHVHDNTSFYNVFKRRQIRKDIASRTGINSWRFFDNSRTKIDEKKIDIRNKLIKAVTTESSSSGKFIRCLFGISSCNFSSDPHHPSNLSSTNPGGVLTHQVKDNTGAVKTTNFEPAAKAIRTMIGNVNFAFAAGNILSILDSFAEVSKAIESGKINDSVAVARGTQAMGIYQVFESSRDQMKTGNANTAEMNAFMQEIGNITASEAWVKGIEGKGDPSKLTDTAASKKYCTNPEPKETEYAYICGGTRIGVSKANELSQSYKDGAGKVLGPVLDKYHKVFGGVIGIFDGFMSKVLGPINSAALATLKAVAPSTVENAKQALAWAGDKLATEIGAGEIINTKTTSGQLGNWLVQGGAYTAESASRGSGAAITNSASQATAQQTTTAYLQDQSSQQSIVARYLSPSNPDSPVSNSLFAVSQLKLSSVANFFLHPLSLAKAGATIFGWPFNHTKAQAASDTGYTLAQLAAIPTYDFPGQCYNLDPLSITPQSGTNAQAILGASKVPSKDLTWNLVTDSTAWYAYLYNKSGNNPKIQQKVKQIYNCNLLDNSVRGSMGYLYGYSQDNGYQDASGASPTITTSSAGETIDVANLDASSTSIACAPGTIDVGNHEGYRNGNPVAIKLCAILGFTSTSEESVPSIAYYVEGAEKRVLVNSRVSGAVYSMFNAAKAEGVTLAANSSYRTMAHQQALCEKDAMKNPKIPNCKTGDTSRVAEPGKSNHQMGYAIDFSGLPSTPGPIAGSAVWAWLSQNAGKYGYQNYPREAWHWSPTGS